MEVNRQTFVVVEDPRCVNKVVETGDVNGEANVVVDGPGASRTVRTFAFTVDGAGPTVTCYPQAARYQSRF